LSYANLFAFFFLSSYKSSPAVLAQSVSFLFSVNIIIIIPFIQVESDMFC
jgi:hypothetical protein